VAVDHLHPLGPEPAGVLLLEPGHEPAGGGDDPPPRDVLIGHAQVVAHRPGRLGEPGLGGDLPVGHHLAGYEGPEHAQHPTFERRHGGILVSDIPEADAMEQAETVDPAPETARDAERLPDDASEADALEQAEEVPTADDDVERG
jgi:hypothetical protein